MEMLRLCCLLVLAGGAASFGPIRAKGPSRRRTLSMARRHPLSSMTNQVNVTAAPPPRKRQLTAVAPSDYLSQIGGGNAAVESVSPKHEPVRGGADYLSQLGGPRDDAPPPVESHSSASKSYKETKGMGPTSYLASLSSLRGSYSDSISAPAPAAEERSSEKENPDIFHATRSFFDLDQLTPKGPRAGADAGAPHDATRTLGEADATSVGSWWCAAGGWPSETPRATTEVFLVLAGRGRVTDADGVRHHFVAGDTVVLPKGWSGRWDVLQPIHKIWVVHDHADVEEKNKPIRAGVTSYRDLVTPRYGAPGGANPQTLVYDVGPTQVGLRTCTPGSYPIMVGDRTECFVVLEGAYFLTDLKDGRARRCAVGDTVMLPRGWTGQLDVIETSKQLSVSALVSP